MDNQYFQVLKKKKEKKSDNAKEKKNIISRKTINLRGYKNREREANLRSSVVFEMPLHPYRNILKLNP